MNISNLVYKIEKRRETFIIKIIFVLFTSFFGMSIKRKNSIRAFHLDCGRKYFTPKEIKDLIKELKENHFNYLELAIGNSGLRFLLDDMSISINNTTFSSSKIIEGIQSGNKKYYDAGIKNELSENEMNDIIEYSRKSNIEIIPLINTPGHMEAILSSANNVIGNCSFESSMQSIDITNEKAINFTKAILKKYIDYFSKKGIKYFNLGCDEYGEDVFPGGEYGLNYLVKNEKYVYFIKYLNEMAQLVKDAKMTPIAFNDGIYYNHIKSLKLNGKEYTPDKNITVSYWAYGTQDYNLALPDELISDGFKILNTNSNWYYILGNFLKTDNLKDTPYNDIIGYGKNKVVGCMVCFWCDNPYFSYDQNEINNVYTQIRTFFKSNLKYFKY